MADQGDGMLTYRDRGFTLVELLVVITILGIIAALGMPSFSRLIANTKIRVTAQSIHDGLQLTRAEAIRINERVNFALASDNSWTITTDAGTVVQTRPAADGSDIVVVTKTPSAATKVTFNALGRLVANASGGASLTQIDVDVPTSVMPANVSQDLRILVGTGGSLRLCDPNKASGDPQACS